MSKRNLIRILVVIAVIAILGFIFFRPKKNKTDERMTFYVVEEVIKNHIQVSGNIEAAEKQLLQSPGEGIVQKVNVKEGDIVKKGDLLFSLDSSMQQMQVTKQEFAVEQERINGSSISLRIMEKELELSKKQFHDRSVYAQFDGIIAMFNLSPGYYAKAQDNFGVLIDRSYLKSTVEVSERDVPKLKVGQTVLINFAALPDVDVEGKIIAYPSIAKQGGSGNTFVETKLIVENPPAEILPGYSFFGKIIIGEDRVFTLIDQSAMYYEQGKPYVKKIVSDNKTENVYVEVEPYMQGFVKLISGDLKVGDALEGSYGGQY